MKSTVDRLVDQYAERYKDRTEKSEILVDRFEVAAIRVFLLWALSLGYTLQYNEPEGTTDSGDSYEKHCATESAKVKKI